MRRALAGIVPSEILERKRKAFVSRGLVKVLAAEWQRLKRRGTLCGEEMGFVVSQSLDAAVKQAEQGNDVPIIPLLRTLALEQWLRDLSELSIQRNISLCDNAIETPMHDAPQELLGRERPR
jgi:asparagine synthase (glutamine-hydrolysing)